MATSKDRTHPGFGCCIYCGSTENLSREHIIPHSIGGNFVITDGSCADCARETHAFEGHLAGRVFGTLRGALNFPTRNRKKRQSGATLKFEADGMTETVQVPFSQIPVIQMVAPFFPPPGILRGDSPDNQMMPVKFLPITLVPKDQKERAAKLGKTGPVRVGEPAWMHVPAFMRMLAKIGHGFAVVSEGLDSFIPYLPPYILGKKTNLGYVVGCPQQDPGLERPAHSHHSCAVQHAVIDDKCYVGTIIQLFGEYGYPPYLVICGEVSPERAQEILAENSPPAQP